MNNLAVYDGEQGTFKFDVEKLRKAGLELNVLRDSNFEKPSSNLALHLLIFKAFKNYFTEEKIIYFDAIDCYYESLKLASNLVDKIRANNYFLPLPINPNKFTQEQILDFYQKENFNPLLGMLAFIEDKYTKKFEKK
jgi:hypothetical protein